MRRNYLSNPILNNLFYILIGIAITAGLFSLFLNLPSQTARAAESASPLSFQVKEPNSPQAATWTNCTPIAVATFPERIHVECAASVGGIKFFAAPTSNPANAARILSTLSAAHVAGRTLSILYDPADTTTGPGYNCLASDCRPIIAAGIGQ